MTLEANRRTVGGASAHNDKMTSAQLIRRCSWSWRLLAKYICMNKLHHHSLIDDNNGRRHFLSDPLVKQQVKLRLIIIVLRILYPKSI